MNIKKILMGASAGVMMFGSLAIPAFAAPGDNGQGNGGCVDNFYGNATNPRPSGNGVLPSQSPGPWLNNPGDPENPTAGPSMGDVMQFTTALGLNGKETMVFVCLFP